VRLEELSPAAAAPVLRQYLGENRVTAPYFEVDRDASEADFEREAPRHPVFRLRAEG
jgi:hypothetical protein